MIWQPLRKSLCQLKETEDKIVDMNIRLLWLGHDLSPKPVPINKDNVSVVTFNMRTDILEELGLVEQAEAISSIQDIEEIFKL